MPQCRYRDVTMHGSTRFLKSEITRLNASDFLCREQETEATENEAWLEHVTAVLLGSGRRSFLAALSGGLGSPDAGLVAACLTTAGWLSRSLASSPLQDTHTDMQLAAFSALVPRLKRCLAGGAAHLQPRHRVLATVTLHNFSKIPGNYSNYHLPAPHINHENQTKLSDH